MQRGIIERIIQIVDEVLKGAVLRYKDDSLSKCKICRQPFERRSITHKCCSVECAKIFAERERERKQKREIREAKQKLKPRAQWAKEAQAACNEFVRFIDREEGCISCGTRTAGQWDAGHFRTTKAAPELRFHIWQIWKQCSVCNQHKSGNILEYRKALIAKIGIDAVDWIEGPHQQNRLRTEDYAEIKQHFKTLLSYAKKHDLKRKDFS